MSLLDRDRRRLNRAMPINCDVKLGDIIQEMQEKMEDESDVPEGSITTDKFAPDAKAPFAGKADEANSVEWSSVQNKPTNYKPESHTHPIDQVEGLQAALNNKLSDVPDKSINEGKITDELLSRIDEHKFTPLSGNGNDADQLTGEGIYFNSGGYGLINAPRGNYGWMLIVSHGSSNGHPRGGQLFLDKEGFDFRGFDGESFTEWESFIIKNKVEHLEPIANPEEATVEDVANAYNTLLTALKG